MNDFDHSTAIRGRTAKWPLARWQCAMQSTMCSPACRFAGAVCPPAASLRVFGCPVPGHRRGRGGGCERADVRRLLATQAGPLVLSAATAVLCAVLLAALLLVAPGLRFIKRLRICGTSWRL